MRGGVQLTIAPMLLLVILSLGGIPGGFALRCDRTPAGQVAPPSPADNRFVIAVSGNPSLYVPGEVYTVSLQGTQSGMVPHKFSGFVLAVQAENVRGLGPYSPTVGSFQLFADALTQYSDRCPNAVTHTSSIPKSDIQVMWKAPPPGSGCVVIKATVIEHRDVWYMDDGPLSKVLCEDVQESEEKQPDILDPCCACEEAKYEITFEGLWSRHTHPKDFPTNGWLTRFSDVIGASHTASFRFWEYGKPASEGLREVAELGATRRLESELKAESDHIRTIIKARGISYPNVTGKTFAVFRVDNKHHLVSLVSMIDPSPDWIVGVSALELCLKNCSWVESKVLNLYPWDAGTDSGPTYISPDQPTTPRDVIRRIKSNYPADPKSPFFNPDGEEMKPLARLYISRQRLYEKVCDPSLFRPIESDSSFDDDNDITGPCAVTEYQEWSECSATCGKGTRQRQRFYRNHVWAQIRSCRSRLIKEEDCWGSKWFCSEQPKEYLRKEDDPLCELKPWSEWSGCSAPCGNGTRTQDRSYKNPSAMKYCAAGRFDSSYFEHNERCIGEKPECDESDNQELMEKEGCEMTPWSSWSPCSASCGTGNKIRTRYPLTSNEEQRQRFRYATHRRHMNRRTRHSRQQDVNFEEETMDEACAGVKTIEEVVCVAEEPTCDINPELARQMCNLPKQPGSCNHNIQRWYFDAQTEQCQAFNWSGCEENGNNFDTQERCVEICNSFREELQANRTLYKRRLTSEMSNLLAYNLHMSDDAFAGLQPGNHIIDSHPYDGPSSSGREQQPAPALENQDEELMRQPSQTENSPKVIYVTSTGVIVHCEYSRWSEWSECTGSCGVVGFMTRERKILTYPSNGGKPCTERTFRRRECSKPCTDDQESGGGDALDPTWGPANKPSRISVDCIPSKWSPWSPCSETCGPNSVQIRTRNYIQSHSGAGVQCPNRRQVKSCKKSPCEKV